MTSAVRDPRVAAAIDRITADLDVLADLGDLPTHPDDALVEMREVEVLGRRIGVVAVAVEDRVDRSGLHKVDGHASAKIMVRHAANLSDAAAVRRDQVMKMERSMPAVAAGHRSGRIGGPQAERIARVFANKRVREQLVEADEHVAVLAARLPYRELDIALSDWERLADEDGAGDKAERAHAGRHYRMPRNLDGTRRIEGSCGSVDGQIVDDIIARQIQREWERDWADARCAHGDAATVDDLARTDAQRSFDALAAVVIRGDLALGDVEGAAQTCTNIVSDPITLERHIAKLCGQDPGPDPRLPDWWRDLDAATADLDHDDDACGAESESESESPEVPVVGFRCSDLDGHPLDPTEVTVATLIGQLRRVVIGADSVVLDMGRKQRFFTGARQLAVRLAHSTCVFTACHVPSSQCQSDHIEAFNGPGQGSTDPGNGAPQCGRHNRLKEQGLITVRDKRGRWHTYRPDGTELT